MRLTLEAITVIDAIDRRGSFSAAAEALHKVPSAITYTVQKLEQDLGVAIFDRAGYRAVLTPAGRELLEHGRHLLLAAEALESRVCRVATGWESQLSVVVDAIIPISRVMPLIDEFYRQQSGTRLRLGYEVLGGSWDALVSNRADLVIGATGEGPPGGGYVTRQLGSVEMVFVVPKAHPLALEPEPLPQEKVRQYRAIAVADSSRNLPPRTSGLLSGQDVLTVADMDSKILAHRAGLGVGTIPANRLDEALADDLLTTRRLEGDTTTVQAHVAWRQDHKGKALSWFVEALADEALARFLLQ